MPFSLAVVLFRSDTVDHISLIHGGDVLGLIHRRYAIPCLAVGPVEGIAHEMVCSFGRIERIAHDMDTAVPGEDRATEVMCRIAVRSEKGIADLVCTAALREI